MTDLERLLERMRLLERHTLLQLTVRLMSDQSGYLFNMSTDDDGLGDTEHELGRFDNPKEALTILNREGIKAICARIIDRLGYDYTRKPQHVLAMEAFTLLRAILDEGE